MNTEPAPDAIVDPGVAPFGNFINYYQFNTAEERLKLLPTNTSTDFWSQSLSTAAADNSEPYIVLDIGCNAGNVTQLLYSDFLPAHLPRNTQIYVLGIDIDAELIARAVEHNQHPDRVRFMCVDVMSDDAGTIIERYLAEIVPSTNHLRLRFNAVFCLSLTMWIHLNNGDDGLREFLHRSSGLAELLVIEPQPWKCYGTAVRRQKRAAGGRREGFELFGGLRWRSDIEERIDEYLVAECGRKRVFRTEPTKWNRRIALYVRNEAEVVVGKEVGNS